MADSEAFHMLTEFKTNTKWELVIDVLLL